MAEPIATRTKEEETALARVDSTLRGKWRLNGLLGVGGVAAVYAATHRNGQRAALKIMHSELARDRSIVERFLREAYVANKVGHPTCVRVLDDDTTEADEPFLVMELLEGETVRDYWRRTGRTIPANQALHIAERVLDCLAACHAVGVVHRDLKPANIFMTSAGAIKLLDFGVAREEGMRHEGDKTLGLALGTPAYMSPEQANGQVDRIDGRSDLFSIGALLHALITGKRIHRGKTEKESLLLAANEPVPSVSTIDPSLPSELVRLIDKALAWEVERRWQTAREMQSATIAATRVVEGSSRGPVPALDDEESELPELTPVHEVIARDDPRVRELEAMFASWEQAIVAGVLHGFGSAVAEPSIRRAFDACVEIQRRRNTPINIVIRPFGFAAYDHVLWQPQKPLAGVPHRLFEGGVRVLRLMPGLSFAELGALLSCLATPGDVDVAGLVWEASLPHVRSDACVVGGLGDVANREAFAAESLRDEKAVAHRVHAARDIGAAWSDESSPLAPDEVIRAVYASQLAIDHWHDRYAELYTDGLVEGARTKNVAFALGALRKLATELYLARRYEEAAALRRSLVERLGQRVGPNHAPKLAAAVTGAMLGKEALDALLRTVAQNPGDAERVASQLKDVPPSEAGTVLAAAARPMTPDAQRVIVDLVRRTAGPAEADAFGDRASAVPTLRNELTPDAILPPDDRAETYARIITSLAAVLEGAAGHTEALASLTRALAEEAAQRFEIFFAEAATFIDGRMLYAERAVHEAASRIASLLARCGAHALVVTGPPSSDQVAAFAKAVIGSLDRAAPLPSVGPLALLAMSQAARTRGVVMERLAIEPRVMRVRASAVATLRARGASSELTPGIAHAARSIVDIASAPAWLLAAATEPELCPDEASLAVSAAMLAAAMARLLTEDRAQIVRVVLAALTLPKATRDETLGQVAAILSSQTSGHRTNIARSVIAFEAMWLARTEHDGPPYRGARAPTLHSRILACARTYMEQLADKTPPPPTPQSVVASLAQKTNDTAERTVLRLLVATLGFVPAGTVVRLSSGETAEVIVSNRGSGRGPAARLVLDESGEEYSEPFEVELALYGDEGLRIEKIVSVDQWRKGEVVRTPKPMPVERRITSARSPPIPREEDAGDQVSVSGARPAAAKPSASPAAAPVAATSTSPGANPTATGNLATTPLVHTLVYMLDHGLTGTFELREPDGVRHQIHFVQGGPVRVRTGRLMAPLGALLVASGLLGESDANDAVAVAKRTGTRLGEHLIHNELVARDDLLRALEVQVTRKIEQLANLDGGTTFAFFRDVNLDDDPSFEPLEVDALGTVFAAARAWSDRSRIQKVIEHANNLLLAIHPDSPLDVVDLGLPERTLFDELRTHTLHVSELMNDSPVPRDTLESFLFAAIVTRQLLVPGQAKAPMGIGRVSKPPPEPVQEQPPSSKPPMSMRAAAQKKISWSDLLAVRRPPSTTAMRAQSAPPRTPVPQAAPTAPPTSVTSPAPPSMSRPVPAALTGTAADAIALVRRAEQTLAHQDIQGAVRLATRAVERDPNITHVNAFYAWVRVLAGEVTAAQAVGMIDRALKQDESCTPARLYRAKLLKRADRVPEAVRDFELVVAAEPDNREAQNELRLLKLMIKPNR